MTNLNYEENRFLDVVNENDEVVSKKPRTDVHRLDLLHREVHVWMFDENKNIFFQKRGLHRPSAGLLDATVGGHVNVGEDYLEAAVRETKEETGIIISPSDLILSKKFKGTSKPLNENWAPVNNFFRMVYIYKNPISEKQIKKEGVPGGGFQKVSLSLLENPSPEYAKMLQPFVIENELPYILNHIHEL